jgi:hypothetical protein
MITRYISSYRYLLVATYLYILLHVRLSPARRIVASVRGSCGAPSSFARSLKPLPDDLCVTTPNPLTFGTFGPGSVFPRAP